jgi:hypothetical protein
MEKKEKEKFYSHLNTCFARHMDMEARGPSV